jgi:PAS domain-containing protein
MGGMAEVGHRRAELAAFLRAMRARLAPEDVGLPRHGVRRTPGLRRQEVAQSAAVSVDWYIRLEQGRAGSPSASVLDGIAEALRLSPAEREHLHLLARGELPPPRGTSPSGGARVSPSVRYLIDGMPLVPAYVVDFRFDILARNDAAAAVFGEDFGRGGCANAAVVLFEDELVRAQQLDWTRIARETVGNLRVERARHGDDERLGAVISRLRRDPDFASWWEDRTVMERAHGTKRVRRAGIGDLTLRYDYLSIPGDDGDHGDQRLVTVTPADAVAENGIRTLLARRAARLAAETGVRTLAA